MAENGSGPEAPHDPDASAPASAARGDPDPVAELELSGLTDHAGEIRGKGTLTLFLSDAAEASVSVDYRRDDRLVVGIESETGIRLGADDSLTLSGGLSRDLFSREIEGHVTAELELARDLEVELEQEFGTDGPRTSVALELRFS